jgi:hypothetical protein
MMGDPYGIYDIYIALVTPAAVMLLDSIATKTLGTSAAAPTFVQAEPLRPRDAGHLTPGSDGPASAPSHRQSRSIYRS